jgi:bifunctional non-homologous end joining protein LigD
MSVSSLSLGCGRGPASSMGEAVVCDDNGMTNFDRVRYRRNDASVFLCAFNLIEVNGDHLRRDPLEVRKATLADIVARAAPGIWFNDHIEEEDGETVFRHAGKLGLEGIVSKPKDSPYRLGAHPDWLKMKNPEPYCAPTRDHRERL